MRDSARLSAAPDEGDILCAVEELDELIRAGSDTVAFQDIMRAFGGTSILPDVMMDQLASARAGSAGAPAGAPGKSNYYADVDAVRRRLKSDTFLLLNPKGWHMQTWGMCTLLAIFYTLTVTPYEIGLDLKTKVDLLLMINQFVTVLFMFDMVFQFFLPVPVKGAVDGKLERRHSVLAWEYMRSWFLLDLFTVIPFDLMLLFDVQMGPAKVTRLLRVLRLAKMLKVIRGAAILQRWEDAMAIPSTTLQLTFWSFLGILMLHWFSCFWCLLPVLSGSQRPLTDEANFGAFESELAERLHGMSSDGTCTGCVQSNYELQFQDAAAAAYCDEDHGRYASCLTPCEMEILANITDVSNTFVYYSESWICRAVDSGLLTPKYRSEPFTLYVAALLVAMLQARDPLWREPTMRSSPALYSA
jgi:hypothetical protein